MQVPLQQTSTADREDTDPTVPAQEKIRLALQQAQQNCDAAQWSATIAACEAAIAQCQKLIHPATHSAASTNPDRTAAALYQAKGDLFKKQGSLTEAIAAYQQALALNPEANEIATALGDLYLTQARQLQQSDETVAATHLYLKALTHAPRLFTAYSKLRYNLLRYDIPRGDPLLQAVVKTCQSILAKHPNIQPARITLAYALTKLNRLPQAIACYRSIATSPEDASRRAPDFIVIGAEKSGTTSLHQYLRSHPQVIPPVEKEIDFFDLEYSCGLDWYLAHFPPASSKLAEPDSPNQASLGQTHWITGETSANYLYSDVAPTRIFDCFPRVKLAVILRNPVDRTVSRYNMMVRNGTEKRDLATAMTAEIDIIQQATTGDNIAWKALNRCRHIGNSLYYHHLKRWLAVFPQEQLIVLQSEDLFEQPEQTMQQLYGQLGLASNRSPQKYPPHNTGEYQPANSEVQQQLATFFTPYNRKLEQLLNRSFRWETNS